MFADVIVADARFGAGLGWALDEESFLIEGVEDLSKANVRTSDTR
jgi:hypothetical protein